MGKTAKGISIDGAVTLYLHLRKFAPLLPLGVSVALVGCGDPNPALGLDLFLVIDIGPDVFLLLGVPPHLKAILLIFDHILRCFVEYFYCYHINHLVLF